MKPFDEFFEELNAYKEQHYNQRRLPPMPENKKYEELVKILREDAERQHKVLHVCASTMNAIKAADAITALITRAEKAEKERDAAIEDIPRTWHNCKSKWEDCDISDHEHCSKCPDWQYRGIQERKE
jgi:hypothetical protein